MVFKIYTKMQHDFVSAKSWKGRTITGLKHIAGVCGNLSNPSIEYQFVQFKQD